MSTLSPDDALTRARALVKTSASRDRTTIEALLDQAGVAPHLVGEAMLTRGNLHFMLGEYDQAIALAEQLAASPEPLLEGVGHNLLGAVYLERGAWAAALDAFEAAARRLPPSETARLGNVHNNLGLLCWRLDELSAAADHFERAADAFVDTGRVINAGNVRNNLGMVRREQGRLADAREDFEAAYRELETAPTFQANALANLARLDEEEGELERAERRLVEALEIRTTHDYKRGMASALLALARVRHARGDLERAGTCLERGRAYVEELDLQTLWVDALEIEASIHASYGRWKEAYAARVAMDERKSELDRQRLQKRVEAAHNRAVLQEARREASRRAEEAETLRRARDTAETALQARDAFLATTSHELRGPLTVVMGACDLLALRLDDPDDVELLETARGAADLLRTVVGDVLELSRLAAGEFSLRLGPVDVRALVAHLVDMARAVRPRAAVDVRCHVAPDTPDWVLGDADRIRQVLLNLLSNGVKYTASGHVTLDVSWQDGVLAFEVEDTGVGISEAFVSRLFQPFQRARTSFVDAQGGTGLGLSIARRLAEAMEGEVLLERTGPDGSVFAFRLPARRSSKSRGRSGSPSTMVGAQHIMVVDDDPVVRTILARMLESLGHTVVEASGARQAQQHAFSMFDWMFVDLRMPEMSGLELARLVLAGPSTPRIVMVSGEVDEQTAPQARALGVLEVLRKPVRLEQLRRILARPEIS